MSKWLLSRFVTAALSLSIALSPLGALAQTANDDNLCQAEVEFFFFNGVQTTRTQADAALGEFRLIHGTRATHTGDRIRYETLYNYSSGFEDFVETFEQRLQEQESLLEGRYELFFEALRGQGAWWSNIVDAVPAAAGILDSFKDWVLAGAVAHLTSLAANPPTIQNYAEHQTRIDSMVLEGRKMLFVAHSQGNLFANAAYTYALSKTSADSVKEVHIAPASPTLNGPHTLADLDLVINGLRLVGTVPPITDTMPGYLQRPAGLNDQKDALGHGLLEIYLNPHLSVSTRVKAHIESALDTLIAPVARATAGFFTATLVWDGAGDVDLHTYEPTGAHVWYAGMRGDVGYLDVDNTWANGPEHYYASCNRNQLKEGTYQIKLANYARAEGRTATVQIASWSDGVLGTKSVGMGPATGNTPAYPMFDVIVKKNPETGSFSVELGQ